jgi:hypothetical protein
MNARKDSHPIRIVIQGSANLDSDFRSASDLFHEKTMPFLSKICTKIRKRLTGSADSDLNPHPTCFMRKQYHFYQKSV